jgi:3-dehydroquinate dehydratase II
VSAPARIALLHGPNLNMLGRRPSKHYGTLTLGELEQRVRDWGRERDMTVAAFQTNHEGSFLEHVHGLAGAVDGAIVNPGAWTHYQWSIRDALELLEAPFIEVHLSDIEAREPHRRQSVVRDIAAGAIWGKGPEGYREALDRLAEILR